MAVRLFHICRARFRVPLLRTFSLASNGLKENVLRLMVNGEEKTIVNPTPSLSLLDYLRDTEKLKGTKYGCGEGGCGACTVTLTSWDPVYRKVVHRSVDSCLTPLCSLDQCVITTVEGIGSKRTGMHQVQEEIAHHHGSQCGFCTPGIVMSAYTVLCNHEHPTIEDFEDNLDGNLCRCTGYRPIIDALKKVSSEKKSFVKPLVPEHFKNASARFLHFVDEKSSTEWLRPTTVDQLLSLTKSHPEAKIVLGNTELGVDRNIGKVMHEYFIDGSAIPSFRKIFIENGTLHIAPAVTLTELRQFLADQMKMQSSVVGDWNHELFKAIDHQLRYFAGTQIRNVASVVGNLVTASPTSDLNPIWLSNKSVVKTIKAGGVKNTIPIRDFFLSYRKVRLDAGEVIAGLEIPLCKEFEFVQSFKQARRKEDDISIVNAGFRLRLKETSNGFVVKEANLAFGCMAIKPIAAMKTEEFLVNKVWNRDTLHGALHVLSDEMRLKPGTPGGMETYRTTLCLSFLTRYYLRVTSRLVELGKGKSPLMLEELSEDELVAAQELPRKVSTGSQDAPKAEPNYQVGNDAMHQSAELQVCGEAKFVDDLPVCEGELFGALVLSTKPHARILRVDATEAVRMEGVEGFFDHKSIPVNGSNRVGAAILDEPVFAEDEVTCVGQPIGIIVAKTKEVADLAARMVKISYEELPAILTIDDAVKEQSFFEQPQPSLHRGNVDEAMKKCEFVESGEMRMGGQEQFYLETQAALVQYDENDDMIIYASTQCPAKSQKMVAKVLGLKQNQVIVRTKRVGGAFGGKEFRNMPICCYSAVPANALKRPVRLIYERPVDMKTTGQRHPFVGKYTVGFDKSGKIQAVDLVLYSNGGHTLDCSGPVIERAVFHSENAYFVPNFRVDAKICKTNLPPNTAFRGFGAPQGMIMAETMIDLVSKKTGIPSHIIRQQHLYQEGQTTPYLMEVKNCNMTKAWDKMMEMSDYVSRRSEVEAFNKKNRFRKRGIACIPVKFGISFTATFLNQGSSLVHVYQDGTVLVSIGGVEMGQGLHTKVAQIAADVFGIPIGDVRVADTSTEKIPNNSPTAASLGSDLYGMATLMACEKIAKRLEPIRAVNAPDASFGDIANDAYFARVNLSAQVC
eukprot:TRINITY_DN19508_c0_g1_i3.p1 TRINITY_DN19508_c0_g1~~TRINITY_DN19508_c0_g1_i3.p1  ORF type:complete len:1132 (-),score=268.21 TRINITY_DN19508_c0_g1_i3:1221-4616(-)